GPSKPGAPPPQPGQDGAAASQPGHIAVGCMKLSDRLKNEKPLQPLSRQSPPISASGARRVRSIPVSFIQKALELPGKDDEPRVLGLIGADQSSEGYLSDAAIMRRARAGGKPLEEKTWPNSLSPWRA